MSADPRKTPIGDVLVDLIDTFGLLENAASSDATYILPDGKILDTMGPESDKHQHVNVANYISKKYNVNDLLHDGSKVLTKLNAIRITPWLPGFYIPPHKPSSAQIEMLVDFLLRVQGLVKSGKPLMISTIEGDQFIEFKDINDPYAVIDCIMGYYRYGLLLKEDTNNPVPQFIDYDEILLEDTRTALINKSKSVGTYKDQSRGKNRFERKKYSKVANQVKSFNTIDMNDFFKKDILQVSIPVTGETDSYTVTVKIEGVVAEIAKNIKSNNNKFEFRTVLQALTKVFNTTDVYIKCTCPDHMYNYAHWNIINNVSTDDTSKDPGPGKNIKNPHDDKGRGCKHILLVLANGDWLMKVASVINNYVHYAEEHLQKPFLKIIFPKLYGVPADEAVENGLLDTNDFLDSSKGMIDAINEYGRNRGKYTKGSNKNPVTGTGGKTKKEVNSEENSEETDENK